MVTIRASLNASFGMQEPHLLPHKFCSKRSFTEHPLVHQATFKWGIIETPRRIIERGRLRWIGVI